MLTKEVCGCARTGLRKGEGRAQAQWRTEKLKRKEMQLRIANTEEELQGLRAGKGNLDKVCVCGDEQAEPMGIIRLQYHCPTWCQYSSNNCLV